jgi:hypothetical protein
LEHWITIAIATYAILVSLNTWNFRHVFPFATKNLQLLSIAREIILRVQTG